jgi:hypothetical protein
MTRDIGLLIIGIALIAWGSCGCAAQLPANHPCSEQNPEAIRQAARCVALVQLTCAHLSDDECPAVARCDELWEKRCAE